VSSKCAHLEDTRVLSKSGVGLATELLHALAITALDDDDDRISEAGVI